MRPMKKQTAIYFLGGTISNAARTLGISRQAVHQWPDPVPQAVADRILAHRVRQRAEAMRSLGMFLDPLEQDAVEL
jgi:hypothetical protein